VSGNNLVSTMSISSHTGNSKDLFISYSSKDKAFVTRLATDLTNLGLKVWIDRFEMRVGDSLNKKIQAGISESAWLGVVLSPDSVSSAWVEKEINAALALELEKQDVFVLPILHRDCKIPIFLRDKIYADFRNTYDDGITALLERIKPPIHPKIIKKLMSSAVETIQRVYSEIPDVEREPYVKYILQSLENERSSIRTAALTALFALRDKKLQNYLIRMTADPSNTVRRFAVFYLGELRLKAAIAVISEHLSDESPDVRAAARDAYKKITGKSG